MTLIMVYSFLNVYILRSTSISSYLEFNALLYVGWQIMFEYLTYITRSPRRTRYYPVATFAVVTAVFGLLRYIVAFPHFVAILALLLGAAVGTYYIYFNVYTFSIMHRNSANSILSHTFMLSTVGQIIFLLIIGQSIQHYGFLAALSLVAILAVVSLLITFGLIRDTDAALVSQFNYRREPYFSLRFWKGRFNQRPIFGISNIAMGVQIGLNSVVMAYVLGTAIMSPVDLSLSLVGFLTLQALVFGVGPRLKMINARHLYLALFVGSAIFAGLLLAGHSTETLIGVGLYAIIYPAGNVTLQAKQIHDFHVADAYQETYDSFVRNRELAYNLGRAGVFVLLAAISGLTSSEFLRLHMYLFIAAMALVSYMILYWSTSRFPASRG